MAYNGQGGQGHGHDHDYAGGHQMTDLPPGGSVSATSKLISFALLLLIMFSITCLRRNTTRKQDVTS